MPPDFHLWANAVWQECRRLGRSAVSPDSPLVDCRLAFDLGYSPERAARAVLRLDPVGYGELTEASRAREGGG